MCKNSFYRLSKRILRIYKVYTIKSKIAKMSYPIIAIMISFFLEHINLGLLNDRFFRNTIPIKKGERLKLSFFNSCYYWSSYLFKVRAFKAL